MSPEPIRIAVGDYDHTRDLTSGEVAVEGVDVTAIGRPEDMFSRFLEGGEFEGAELSLAVTTVLAARGDDRFVALPIFPARSFRHSAFYALSDGPEVPAELAGARIGIPVWAQTAGVYARGILATRYGVDLQSIEWVCAGVDEPGREEPVDIDHGPFNIQSVPETTLDEMLLTGVVDAVISARPPASVEQADPRVRRLFADPAAEERVYFQETGVFPIMHVLVVRREAYEAHPQLARKLVGAFEEAKCRSLRRALSATVPSFPLPWASVHAREAREIFGADFWPYGLNANRLTLEAFLGYAADQYLTHRRLSVAELFADTPILQPLT